MSADARVEKIAPIPGTERLPTTEQFDAIWNELLHDPHLAAVRQKLSVHDLRLLIGQITRSFIAADPLTQEHAKLKTDVIQGLELLLKGHPELETMDGQIRWTKRCLDALLDRLRGGVK